MGEPIRLALIDDHPLILEGLRANLRGHPEVVVVGEYGTATEALSSLRREPVEVALIDISLPDGSGLDLVAWLAACCPRTRTVILSMHDEPELVRRAIAAGARGYIVKDEVPPDLARVVVAIAGGQIHYSPRVATGLIRDFVDGRQTATVLTPREQEVARAIASGLTTAAIAHRLGIRPATVDTYRQRLMKKLDLHSVAEVTRYAVQAGLVGEGE